MNPEGRGCKMYFVSEIYGRDRRVNGPDIELLPFVNTQGWTKDRCFDYVRESGKIRHALSNESCVYDKNVIVYAKYLLTGDKFGIYYVSNSPDVPVVRMESSGRFVLEDVLYMDYVSYDLFRMCLIVRDTEVTLRGLCIERYQGLLKFAELPDDLRDSICKSEF